MFVISPQLIPDVLPIHPVRSRGPFYKSFPSCFGIRAADSISTFNLKEPNQRVLVQIILPLVLLHSPFSFQFN